MQVEDVKKYDRLKPLTLLYVEDSKFLSKVTVSGISTYFNKIYVAYNGQEGLDLLVSHGNEIDIVITDLDMPVMDGFEMIRRIRGGGCFMPIIVTTALNNYLERENLFELSIDAFLKKPVDTNKLIEKIDYVVDALFIRRELFTKKTMIHNDIIYCETDQNGCITYVSNPFEKISGYTREELLGQTHALLSSHETPQETYKEMWSNLVASKQWQGEFVNKRKDGTFYTVNIIVSPMYLRSKLGNRLVGYSATSLDITHYKAIAKELHIKSRQAAMGEMVAMIAHQWRQPITSIGMIANNLQFDLMMDELDTNVLKENLKTIDSHVKYLSNTINIFRNFLSESKKEEKVMLKSIIDAVLGVVHDICKENGIAIEVQQDCCAIEIRTLKDELIQALINIVTNAHEALLEQKVSQPKISIECAQDQDSITIIITDNAGGIPEELLAKIFTPYFSTKQEKNGTGLGLYMTKTIIEENLEGTLSVSNSNNGALFVIKLPKRR